MAKVIVRHDVADYERWYPVFSEHESVRRQHGATGHAIERDPLDGNSVVIVNEFATLAGARAFATDPSLGEVMGRAGVVGHPTVWIVDSAESKAY